MADKSRKPAKSIITHKPKTVPVREGRRVPPPPPRKDTRKK